MQQKAKAPDVLGLVKAPKTRVISAGTCSAIKCKVKVMMDKDEQSVLFRPEVPENPDDELTYSEKLSVVKRGRTQYIFVDVINTSKRDITLKKGAVIGEICNVSSVVPMRMENL